MIPFAMDPAAQANGLVGVALAEFAAGVGTIAVHG